MKRHLLLLTVMLILLFTACNPSATLTPKPAPSTPTSIMPLLTNEDEGYSLRYPIEYHVVLYGRSICFTLAQTDGRPGACHVANAILDVSNANGRILANVADELAASGNPSIEVSRTNIKIGGEDAILLDNIYTYDVLRQAVVIHDDRVYVFTFVPWVASIDEFQRLQILYSTITESFTFTEAPVFGTLPSFIYPVDGQTLDYEGSYLFKVTPVEGADGYLWGFFQDGVMVWENLRDEGALSGVEYGIDEKSLAHSKFAPGYVEVWVRASINGEWTEPTIITIYLEPR